MNSELISFTYATSPESGIFNSQLLDAAGEEIIPVKTYQTCQYQVTGMSSGFQFQVDCSSEEQANLFLEDCHNKGCDNVEIITKVINHCEYNKSDFVNIYSFSVPQSPVKEKLIFGDLEYTQSGFNFDLMGDLLEASFKVKPTIESLTYDTCELSDNDTQKDVNSLKSKFEIKNLILHIRKGMLTNDDLFSINHLTGFNQLKLTCFDGRDKPFTCSKPLTNFSKIDFDCYFDNATSLANTIMNASEILISNKNIEHFDELIGPFEKVTKLLLLVESGIKYIKLFPNAEIEFSFIIDEHHIYLDTPVSISRSIKLRSDNSIKVFNSRIDTEYLSNKFNKMNFNFIYSESILCGLRLVLTKPKRAKSARSAI